MTALLREALEALQRLPPERQEHIARAILALANDGEPEEIDPEIYRRFSKDSHK
jgi:DNA-binding transcriptional regulator YdaS (Cro superfamily)